MDKFELRRKYQVIEYNIFSTKFCELKRRQTQIINLNIGLDLKGSTKAHIIQNSNIVATKGIDCKVYNINNANNIEITIKNIQKDMTTVNIGDIIATLSVSTNIFDEMPFDVIKCGDLFYEPVFTKYYVINYDIYCLKSFELESFESFTIP